LRVRGNILDPFLIILDELLMHAQEEATQFITLLYAIILLACVMVAVAAYLMHSLSVIVQKLGVRMVDAAPAQTPPKRCLCVHQGLGP